MTPEAVAAAFAEHGSWISRFVIDGVPHGGSFDAMHDPRLDVFFRTFPDAATILELGALEGGHTIALAQHAGVSSVLGVEGRSANLARARLAADLLKATNVRFVHADLENADLAQLGHFDAIFCCGLLYHLPEPWSLVRQFPQISPRAFVWTHYCLEADVETNLAGYDGRMQIEGGPDEPLSGLSSHSFWPSLTALQRMFADAGFARVEILSNDSGQANGPAVLLAASVNTEPR